MVKTNLSRAAAAFCLSLVRASSPFDEGQLLFSAAAGLRGVGADVVTVPGPPAVVLGMGTVLPILAKGCVLVLLLSPVDAKRMLVLRLGFGLRFGVATADGGPSNESLP